MSMCGLRKSFAGTLVENVTCKRCLSFYEANKDWYARLLSGSVDDAMENLYPTEYCIFHETQRTEQIVETPSGWLIPCCSDCAERISVGGVKFG